MKLKTLKDILIEFTRKYDIHESESFILFNKLKAESLKHLKFQERLIINSSRKWDRMRAKSKIEFIKNFFNLTEEDLE